jgi:hypothetical protein
VKVPDEASLRDLQARAETSRLIAKTVIDATLREASSFSCSRTSRTARVRTSGENRFVVLLAIAPPSQGSEPPANPERFTSLPPVLL